MRRPLFLVLPWFLGGVWLESRARLLASLYQSSLPVAVVPWAAVGAAAVLAGSWAALHRAGRQRTATCVICGLALLLGLQRDAVSRYLPPNHLAHLIENAVVTVEGHLYRPCDVRRSRSYASKHPNTYLYVAVQWLELDGMRYRVQGKIRITLLGSDLLREERKTFRYGDVIRTRLRLKRPRNLPDFDYREYLRRRGIYFIGSLKHDRYIVKLPERRGNPWLARLYAVRRKILRFFARYAAGHPEAAPTLQVLQAMTLGTGRQLPAELLDRFRNAGLYHLLVVSGIHVGIVAAALHAVLRYGGVPARYRLWVVMPVLLIFAGFCGFQLPVLRAVIMACVLYAGVVLHRMADGLYSLAFSAAVLVWLWPGALFEASFQMTMMATASILMSYGCWSRSAWGGTILRWPAILRIPVTGVLMSGSALLGIAPLMLSYFQQVSPYSIISTLAAMPIMLALLPAALLLEACALILPWNWLWPGLAAAVALGDALVALAGVFPPVLLTVRQLRPEVVWLYYAGLFGGLALIRRRQKLAGPKREE